MQFLKQSTAATTVIGPVLDSTGAEFTTAVIADLTLTKNGTSAVMSGNTFSHLSNGHYVLALTTTNTNTLGRLEVHCNKAGYQFPPVHFSVLPATVFVALQTEVNLTGGFISATSPVTLAGGVMTPLTAAETSDALLLASIAGVWPANTVAESLANTYSNITALAAKFSGISLLANWLRRIARKDSGTAGMITAEAEINTGGTASYSGVTDSLESISDVGNPAATIELTVVNPAPINLTVET